ncbi:MAG: DUF3445 domain-containing protein [Bacteroidota bacterium]|nr:DUF3445 domain-containing protein [Bacteroidota bacterium]
MQKLKYFPFGEQFDLRMGTSLITEKDRLIDVDNEHYIPEIRAKRKLLKDDHQYYYQSNKNTGLAQWDVVDKVLHDLVVIDPAQFILQKQNGNWHWTNNRLSEETTFVFGDADTLPLEPLDWIGRQVQEDFVILSNDAQASIIAGQLCFANGWSLDDKFNQPFVTIHAPAPNTIAPTIQTAQKLMEKIQISKPVWRCSWNCKVRGDLDLSSKHNARYNLQLKEMAPELTSQNIGQHLYLRIERQTISRLLRSGCVLFGIHLYQNKLDDENLTPQQAKNMNNVLTTTPGAMLNYKAITPFYDALTGYLQNIISKS